MITIRKYKPEDKIELQKICIETSRLPVETQAQRDFLLLLYNDYYTEVEPDNCIVAADENDIPVGYIICAQNFNSYAKTFSRFYLPEIKEIGMSFYIQAVMEMAGHSLYAKKYPAHLHIDILDKCQGQGVGTKLITAMKDNLKSKGVRRLMLSCGADNTGAIRFYKRNGFEVLSTMFGGCIMATKF